jgi:hypothetical protein
MTTLQATRFFPKLAQVAVCAGAMVMAGCVTHESRPQQRINAVQASTEIPVTQLLDVAVKLFDANVPEDEKVQEKQHISPDVRKAEARYIPMQIRTTLEGSGQWGQVRVIPADSDALDVRVAGVILDSTGQRLKIDVKVSDVTGRQWFQKVYAGEADTRSYKDTSGHPRDPFQNLYNTLANDMLIYRQQLTAADLENLRKVSQLRFASNIAPYAFGSYLTKDKQGQYRVQRLPAADDPLVVRMDRIRERDYALLDTVDDYYAVFSEQVTEPYNTWRKYSYNELEEEDEAHRSATSRKLLGVAAIIGGLLVGTQSNTYMGSAVGTAGIIGGVYAIKSGMDKGAEVKMHADSLKQLTESFANDVQPRVVDVEGRTLQLRGSAEEQFREWRSLLKEIYENETGLPVILPASDGSASLPTPAPAGAPAADTSKPTSKPTGKN